MTAACACRTARASGGRAPTRRDLYAQNHPRSANADKPNGIQPMELGQRRHRPLQRLLPQSS